PFSSKWGSCQGFFIDLKSLLHELPETKLPVPGRETNNPETTRFSERTMAKSGQFFFAGRLRSVIVDNFEADACPHRMNPIPQLPNNPASGEYVQHRLSEFRGRGQLLPLRRPRVHRHTHVRREPHAHPNKWP